MNTPYHYRGGEQKYIRKHAVYGCGFPLCRRRYFIELFGVVAVVFRFYYLAYFRNFGKQIVKAVFQKPFGALILLRGRKVFAPVPSPGFCIFKTAKPQFRLIELLNAPCVISVKIPAPGTLFPPAHKGISSATSFDKIHRLCTSYHAQQAYVNYFYARLAYIFLVKPCLKRG